MPGGSQPEISSPEETRGTHETALLRRTQETKWLGLGRCLRCTAHLGQCAHKEPGRLSSSDPGRAQNVCPTESVPLQSTQEPEPEQLRPGKCMQPRAHIGQFPYRETWSLSSVDWKSTRAMSWGKPSVARYCEHSPHMPVIFVSSVPPSQSTTEQVILYK